MGYITYSEREMLNQIFDLNPLLFDYVTKRTIKSPNNGKKFSRCIFMRNPHLKYPELISQNNLGEEI